ncbi:MAG: hypothetical protein EAZ34_07915 [Polaromonas sp.]|nr:MAG: hypothetical protein EAZ34_07915 [Polaromonas sp.]
MKYLVVSVLLLVIFWLWRSKRRPDSYQVNKRSDRRPPPSPALPTEIVACDVCHVHLPRSEALTGLAGVYCCVAHRRQANKG